MCADCENIFLTCPNNTLFFFAFQACRCPTPSPSLRSSTGRSGWFARLKRTSWPSRGWRSTQTSWTWWSRSASSVTTLQAQVFALDVTTRSESYKQAACRFLWCPNKTSIGFIQEIFLFKLFFLQVGLKMGWSYFRQLTGGRLTSNLKKV